MLITNLKYAYFSQGQTKRERIVKAACDRNVAKQDRHEGINTNKKGSLSSLFYGKT
jgi:hypothetical protein